MKKERLQRYRRLFEIFANLAAIIIATLILSYFLALILAPHGLPITDGADRSGYYPIGGLGGIIVLLVLFYPPIQIPVIILLVLGGISAAILNHLGPIEVKGKKKPRYRFEKVRALSLKHCKTLNKITFFCLLIGTFILLTELWFFLEFGYYFGWEISPTMTVLYGSLPIFLIIGGIASSALFSIEKNELKRVGYLMLGSAMLITGGWFLLVALVSINI